MTYAGVFVARVDYRYWYIIRYDKPLAIIRTG